MAWPFTANVPPIAFHHEQLYGCICADTVTNRVSVALSTHKTHFHLLILHYRSLHPLPNQIKMVQYPKYVLQAPHILYSPALLAHKRATYLCQPLPPLPPPPPLHPLSQMLSPLRIKNVELKRLDGKGNPSSHKLLSLAVTSVAPRTFSLPFRAC